MRALFTKKLNPLLIEALLEAKALREAADYYGDFSEANSKKLTKKAKEFLKVAKDIIGEKK